MKKRICMMMMVLAIAAIAVADNLKPMTEQEAVEFLYRYMPLADQTDYPRSFFEENVHSSFTAREEMSWGRQVPELLFRHFVLPVRVNNESLDRSRMEFYAILKERVRGMTMQDAILEVNHWCHEHVSYQPSDARTTSPLTTLRNAIGRCGEESTFTVAALRAIGIPARQVYTPRWAHTDDNHAWVEAWAGGKWYFMGACEPEAVLNLGWFNAPASRALLMHTRAFGDYNGPEEVILRTNNFTEINVIDNYASTARIDFVVNDAKGRPVEKARVDFKIYNYAEFYTAVTKYTNAEGRTFLTAGKGDMVVWASKDGRYGFRKVSFGKDKTVAITLDRDAKGDQKQTAFEVHKLDIVPPAEHVVMPQVSDALQAQNKWRFAREDSIRHDYMRRAFMNLSVDSKTDACLKKARANWPVILDFINRHHDDEERAFGILSTLSDKDFTDITTGYLEDCYWADTRQLEVRVEDEPLLLPYKQAIASAFDQPTADMFRQHPAALVEWMKQNIKVSSDTKALRIAQSPLSALRTRLTDVRSRDILFVAIARSLDIKARKDVVTSKVQYEENGQWVDVDFDASRQTAAPTGTLVLRYEPTPYFENPKYYSHFTLSRIVDGTARLLNFDEGQVDMGGGVSWASTFKEGTQLDAGTYLLVTGTRMANGSVLATHQTFNVRAGKTTILPLHLRQSSDDVAVIGSFDSESKFQKDQQDVSILSQTGRGYFVVGLVGVGQEPTNHALRDIAKVRDAFNAWGRPLLLLFESEAEARKFHETNDVQLPENTIFGVDKDSRIRRQIVQQMKLQNDQLLPIFVIADTFNRVVFSSQGYTIGLGEQMERVIKKLK